MHMKEHTHGGTYCGGVDATLVGEKCCVYCIFLEPRAMVLFYEFGTLKN